MSIGALASALPMVGDLAKAALPVAGEALKAVTEIAKTIGQLVQAQSGGKGGDAGQNKIAHEDTHNHNKPVDFENGNAASSNVNINFS
ncbi:hypothetical protein [Pseudomonas costantinii]|uniref:hypothetical protein n=1 Tax=Pseudomonas costantinii TaxID=168469 RepID=UPI00210EFB07|nr:hypothetical protein [Pseudomonas costantinii]